MIVVTKDGVQHKMNINYLDYMLGFTRESQLKKLLKEGVDPTTALATANGRPPKKAGKKPAPNTTATNANAAKAANTTSNTKDEKAPAADADNAPPLPDDPTSIFTAEQDEQIIKFKAENPQGKWEDLAGTMGMQGRGKELAERFRELKKEGKVGGAGGGEDKKKEDGGKKGDVKKDEDKKEEGKKDQAGGNGGGGGAAGGKKGKGGKDAAAGGGGGEGKKGDKAAATKNFSEEEMTVLRNELVQDEELKGLRIASALYNRTGRDVHPDDVRAALGF